MPTRKRTVGWKLLVYRVGGVMFALALLWFAIEGGEYGTRAVIRQHAKRLQLQVEVAALRHQVDSLDKEEAVILRNDAVLERIAREQYGMVKGSKELLFWLNNARPTKDSSAAATDTLAMR